MPAARKIRVLIVDDSAAVRQTLTQILNADPEIEVVGVASDPTIALARIREFDPDVVTLDVHLRRMDGIAFIEKVMSEHSVPIVICSIFAEDDSETALRALEKGAVYIITRPEGSSVEFLEESRAHICESIKFAGRPQLRKIRAQPVARRAPPMLSADAVLKISTGSAPVLQTTEKVVMIGASTGGTEAIAQFLQAMPADCPGMVIVQHMPEHFTSLFSERLNRVCKVTVKEAADGDLVLRGRALIAPGGYHLLLKRGATRYFVSLNDGPLVSRHRPSVDVLFRSAARYAGKNSVGVIMTGMGDDGSRGMLEMKQAGAFNFAQDEASCIVFGMPNEAIKLGGVDRVLPLSRMASEVLRACK